MGQPDWFKKTRISNRTNEKMSDDEYDIKTAVFVSTHPDVSTTYTDTRKSLAATGTLKQKSRVRAEPVLLWEAEPHQIATRLKFMSPILSNTLRKRHGSTKNTIGRFGVPYGTVVGVEPW